jgi:hypothetical protein
VIKSEGEAELVAVLKMNAQDFAMPELHVAKHRVVEFHEAQVAVLEDTVDKQAGGKIRALQVGVPEGAVIVFSPYPLSFIQVGARESGIRKDVFHALKIKYRKLQHNVIDDICNFNNVASQTKQRMKYCLCFGILILLARSAPVKKSMPKYDVEAIRFNTTGCFGTCPAFGLLLQKDGRAWYTARRDNHPNGKFEGKISSTNYREFTTQLMNIDFPSLQDKYSVDWTDLPTAFLTITYDNGKTKTLRDYGLQGTEALRKLYQVLFDYRYKQKWMTSETVIPAEGELRTPPTDKFIPPSTD